MVEQTLNLDSVFSSLADSTRRDILKHVAKNELSVGEIAKYYNLTFAAVSKHLRVLEKAHLITKRRRGKKQLVQLHPATIKDATDYLEHYQKIWDARFDRLEQYLNNISKEEKHGRT